MSTLPGPADPRHGSLSAVFALVALTLLVVPACSDDEAGGQSDVTSDADGGLDVDATPDAQPDAPADADAAADGDALADGDATDLAEEDGPPDLPPLDWQPHVRGTFNGWEASDPLPYQGDNLYAGSVLISEGPHEFKIADESWTLTTIYSAAADTQIEVELDAEVPLVIATGFSNNTEIVIPEEAEYTFSVLVEVDGDDVSLTLVVTEGAVVPIDDLPDDSQVYSYSPATPAPLTLEGGTGMLAPDALFAALDLVVPAGESVQVVFGDHVDGYFEGWTQAYSSATRYWNASGYVLSYFASLVGGDLQNVETETTATHLLPWGVRNNYGEGVWDEVVLHAGARAVSLRVHSDTPAVLGLIPKLNLRRLTTSWSEVDGVLVFAVDEDRRRAGAPPFMAVAGDRPYQVTGADLDAMPFLEDDVRIRVTDIKPLFTTQGAETDFRVVLAFGFTAAEAAALAAELATTDAVGAHQQATYDLLTSSYLWTSDDDYNRALMWAKLSSYSLVNRQLGLGIWAGLPWFKDNWGRDTFIALPGTLLVNGRFDEAEEVIRQFATRQNTDVESTDYGRIPNRVTSPSDIIYNTTDGTPWMVREILETVRYTGDSDFWDEMYPVVARYLDGAVDNYADAEGFLTHADADTWMDARFGPSAEYAWSARGDRAVEIQVLWYEALRVGAAMASDAGDDEDATAWTALANLLQTNFAARFWDDDSAVMADRVRADDSRDEKVRPNQLMLVSVPFEDRLVTDAIEADVVRNAVSELLFPWGICSLSQDHPYFHPHHDNQPTFNKDAAYHNGTVWLWNAGPTVTALTRFGYSDLAYEVSLDMAEQLLERGTRGSLSELVDAHPDGAGEIILSGTFSQAWSVSEYARNGYQDYLGFRPDLTRDRLVLWPSPPSAWTAFDAQLAFGDGGRLVVTFAREEDGDLAFTVEMQGNSGSLELRLAPVADDGTRYVIAVTLAEDTPVTVVFSPDDGTATVGGESASTEVALASQQGNIGVLELATPDLDAEYPTMTTSNYLRDIIEAGNFE